MDVLASDLRMASETPAIIVADVEVSAEISETTWRNVLLLSYLTEFY